MTSQTAGNGAGFYKVAIGIDFSGSSDGALQLARANFAQAQRLLIHVVDSRAAAIPDLSGAGMVPMLPTADLLETLSENESRMLNTLAQSGEAKTVVSGEPASALVKAACDWGADLLVVGSHTQGLLERFFVGSVAEQVVQKASMPVLVIKSEKR